MPKPRSLKREQRRITRRLARDGMIEAIRGFAAQVVAVPEDTRPAFLDEINRTIAFISRTRVHTHSATAALSDSDATPSELDPDR